MKTKEEIKQLLYGCCEKIIRTGGVEIESTLVFDKVADMVLELVSEQVKQPSGQKSPEIYFDPEHEDVFVTSRINKALTAQAQEHAQEMEAFAEWLDNPENQYEHGEHFFSELLQIFRSSRTGEVKEGEV